jgi:hypothetical protein
MKLASIPYILRVSSSFFYIIYLFMSQAATAAITLTHVWQKQVISQAAASSDVCAGCWAMDSGQPKSAGMVTVILITTVTQQAQGLAE